MKDIMVRLKSGREFRFKCEEYTIETYALNGILSDFSYEGGVGECPVYFQKEDVECIAIIGKEQIEALEQEPCEDAVSRSALLDKAYAYGNGLEPEGYCVEVEDIQALPSVAPTRKKGEWIVYPLMDEGRVKLECPICGDTFIRAVDYKPHFCENCGTKMKG